MSLILRNDGHKLPVRSHHARIVEPPHVGEGLLDGISDDATPAGTKQPSLAKYAACTASEAAVLSL